MRHPRRRCCSFRGPVPCSDRDRPERPGRRRPHRADRQDRLERHRRERRSKRTAPPPNPTSPDDADPGNPVNVAPYRCGESTTATRHAGSPRAMTPVNPGFCPIHHAVATPFRHVRTRPVVRSGGRIDPQITVRIGCPHGPNTGVSNGRRSGHSETPIPYRFVTVLRPRIPRKHAKNRDVLRRVANGGKRRTMIVNAVGSWVYGGCPLVIWEQGVGGSNPLAPTCGREQDLVSINAKGSRP